LGNNLWQHLAVALQSPPTITTSSIASFIAVLVATAYYDIIMEITGHQWLHGNVSPSSPLQMPRLVYMDLIRVLRGAFMSVYGQLNQH
jgi:hypothetical protein